MHLALWPSKAAKAAPAQNAFSKIAPADEKRLRKFNRLNSRLIEAVLDGNLRKTKHLLKKGADVNARDDKGRTPLMLINTVEGKHATDICELLIQKGADVNATDAYGMTELMWASHKGHTFNCMLIFEGGANINARSRSGMTALMWAARNGYDTICIYLIEKGADVTLADSRGMTALMWAEKNEYKDAADVLGREASDETRR
jgi:ankyrin repeat protein